MGDEILAVPIVGMIFVGLPWVILHYVTKWKGAATLTREDENLLDDMHETARRLDDRLATIERIMTADDPHWKTGVLTDARQGER